MNLLFFMTIFNMSIFVKHFSPSNPFRERGRGSQFPPSCMKSWEFLHVSSFAVDVMYVGGSSQLNVTEDFWTWLADWIAMGWISIKSWCVLNSLFRTIFHVTTHHLLPCSVYL